MLVNNAGIIKVGPFAAMALEDFTRAMQVMFWGPLHTTHAVLPGMRARKRGSIVNITSIDGKVSVPHLLPYCCAKFAAVALSEGLTAELAAEGIAAGEELRKMKIGFVSLHGGVPSRPRGALIEKFKNDPECRVFLSTDAGGVGLNLQAASAVINFEPPWNPARLEQRIGLVHRMGQSRPVHVVHMLTTDSIEERVWETMRLKKSLFAGVFDSPMDEVSFAKLGRKTVFQAVKEIIENQPGRPRPVIDPAAPVPLKADAVASKTESPVGLAEANSVGGKSEAAGIGKAVAGLIEAGVEFIEAIAHDGATGSSAGVSGSRLDQILSGLFARDPGTNRPALSIPLPESVTRERLATAISGLVYALGREASGTRE